MGAGLNRLFSSTDFRGEQGLEVEAWSSGAGNCRAAVLNGMRAAAGVIRNGSVGRETPWRENPVRGCGVKQTHKAGGGVNRRGREKRRGRNVAWDLGRLRTEWTPLVFVVMRDLEPHGRRRLALTGFRVGRQRAAALGCVL